MKILRGVLEGAVLSGQVTTHYGGEGELARTIAESLLAAGKDLNALTTADLASVDEFHI